MPTTAALLYARYESAVPNARGSHPGIFAMLTGLRRSGRLDAADGDLVEVLVARSYELHREPDASVFETTPPAISWFIQDPSAVRCAALTHLAEDVIDLLGRYGIPFREVRCSDPGRITYADEVQVVAVPHTHAEHWPFD